MRKPGRQRQHVDARPQGRDGEVVAVQRQPDASQPDDQHELQSAAGHGTHETGRVPGCKCPYLEQSHPEHRLCDLGLDDAEHHQEDNAADQPGVHQRAGPAGGVPAVGLDAIGDGRQQAGRADREQDVARPVDLRALGGGDLPQAAVGPDGAPDADRDVDPEHRAPVPGGQQAAEQQADELARDAGDLVDAKRHPALVGRERVGQDGGRVGHQHGAAEGLHHPPADQP